MDKKRFQKYLQERYYIEIKWYDSKSLWNHSVYKWFQGMLIILSTITPVLILLSIMFPVYSILRASPVITAVAVAIITASLKTFKFQENWINYRTICETLKKEIHFYEAKIDVYADNDDNEALFVERVESLISRENTLWISTHKEIKKEKI